MEKKEKEKQKEGTWIFEGCKEIKSVDEKLNKQGSIYCYNQFEGDPADRLKCLSQSFKLHYEFA